MFKREPALVLGLVQAALVLAVSFGLQLSAEQTTAIAGLMAALFAFVTRSQVSSPATTETLAKGTLRTQASPAQTEKAAEVLGVPASLIQEAVKFAAQGILPTNWAALIVGADYSALAKAVEKARQRPLNDAELKADLNAEIKRRAQ